jgi:hypothetical protein
VQPLLFQSRKQAEGSTVDLYAATAHAVHALALYAVLQGALSSLTTVALCLCACRYEGTFGKLPDLLPVLGEGNAPFVEQFFEYDLETRGERWQQTLKQVQRAQKKSV